MKKENIFRRIGKCIVSSCIYAYCKIVYRVKIIGKENVPEEGSLIFCGNHRTYLDPPLIVVTAGRDMRFFAKEELRKNPLFAFLGFLYRGIYVKRDSKDIGPLKEGLKELKSGGCVGLFPEGTRNGMQKNEGGKLKNGAAYMAIKTGAKIVPIGIVGPAKPFTKNAIIYGKPIDLAEHNLLAKGSEDQASELLKEEIVKLSETNI
jgi:1-acyl-sn-glycerol-3-phosphate acyltransferase